jgi:tetratricopeptide (TPR) repeat protein
MATHELLFKGRALTLPEATKYESLIHKGLNQLSLRFLLLGFYGTIRFSLEDYQREWKRHLLWLITNSPDLEIHKGFGHLDPQQDAGTFVRAKDFWMERVEKNPGNVQIIEQAVDFFGSSDFEKTEGLLTTAKELEPSNAKWHRKLGELFMLKVINKTGDQQKEIGMQSIAHFEEALRKSCEDQARRYLRSLLSQVALKVGELEKARSYATQILHEPYDPEDALDKRCRHVADTILGIIELRAGNNEAAKSYLQAAGQLVADTCPPVLSLAREMLAVGEWKAVADYLRVCAPFLNRNAHEAEQWIYDIEHGKAPNFGPNLEYF